MTIEFKNITKELGGRKILNDLTLTIPEGKITFIIGRSGEGKSVTIKHIVGLMKPDSGNITIADQNITNLSKNELRKLRLKFGILFQHGGLFDNLTIEENIIFPLTEHYSKEKTSNINRVNNVLKKLKIENLRNKLPLNLSVGEQKKAALARALVIAPKYLIYDEPTTSMDPFVSEMIDKTILELNNSSSEITSIVVSHDLKSTLSIADHIILLYQGKAIFQGSITNFRNSDSAIVQQFLYGRKIGPMQI